MENFQENCKVSPSVIVRNSLTKSFEKMKQFWQQCYLCILEKHIFVFVSIFKNNCLPKHLPIKFRKKTSDKCKKLQWRCILSKTMLANQIDRNSLRISFENSKIFSQQFSRLIYEWPQNASPFPIRFLKVFKNATQTKKGIQYLNKP